MKTSKKKSVFLEVLFIGLCGSALLFFAWPQRIEPRVSGTEASAISSLRTLTTVNEQYLTRYGSYATSLAVLQKEGYIDAALGSRVKFGYKFSYRSSGSEWSTAAEPTTWSAPGTRSFFTTITGERSFFTDETGVVRFAIMGEHAIANSPPID